MTTATVTDKTPAPGALSRLPKRPLPTLPIFVATPPPIQRDRTSKAARAIRRQDFSARNVLKPPPWKTAANDACIADSGRRRYFKDSRSIRKSPGSIGRPDDPNNHARAYAPPFRRRLSAKRVNPHTHAGRRRPEPKIIR